MIAALVLIALSGAPPAVDAARVCKDAQSAALPEDAKVAFDSCVRDEQAAREKLAAGAESRILVHAGSVEQVQAEHVGAAFGEGD